MTTEEALDAFGVVDVAESFEHAEPRACVFCKLGIRRLEEDFDAVERADYRLCLSCYQHMFRQIPSLYIYVQHIPPSRPQSYS